MADEEHPEGTGGGGGQKRGKKGKTRPDEPAPPDPGQGEAASAAIAPTLAAQSEPRPGAAPEGDASAVYAPPPPGGASTDSNAERGISGALALWGPLIIIGFLVLVLNTDDAPQRPSAVEAPVASPPEAPEAAAESPPAQPLTQTVTPEAPAEPVAEAAEARIPMPVEEPEAESAAADTVPAAPSSAVVAETTVIESESTRSESTEPVVPALEAPQSVAMAANELAGEGGDSVDSAGELDLDAVLEVARSVIGQAGVEAASQAVAAAQAPPPPPASAIPAATMATEAQIVVPAPAAGVATGAWGAPQPEFQAGYPVWSSNPGASARGPVPPSQGEAMWGTGATEPGGAAGDADWPPPPETAAVLPPLHPAPAMVPGSGYWPRPPVLVPCAPPYYWCVALPSPLYHPAPPAAY